MTLKNKLNIACFSRNGNGCVTRIWLALILKKESCRVMGWNFANKEDDLSTMQRGVVKNIEIKALLKNALIDQIHDYALFMKSIDVSYDYEGYSAFKTEKL